MRCAQTMLSAVRTDDIWPQQENVLVGLVVAEVPRVDVGTPIAAGALPSLLPLLLLLAASLCFSHCVALWPHQPSVGSRALLSYRRGRANLFFRKWTSMAGPEGSGRAGRCESQSTQTPRNPILVGWAGRLGTCDWAGGGAVEDEAREAKLNDRGLGVDNARCDDDDERGHATGPGFLASISKPSLDGGCQGHPIREAVR